MSYSKLQRDTGCIQKESGHQSHCWKSQQGRAVGGKSQQGKNDLIGGMEQLVIIIVIEVWLLDTEA